MAMGSSDVSDIEDITDYDNDAVGQPVSHLLFLLLLGIASREILLVVYQYDCRKYLPLSCSVFALLHVNVITYFCSKSDYVGRVAKDSSFCKGEESLR